MSPVMKLSLEHIFLFCSDLIDIREKYVTYLISSATHTQGLDTPTRVGVGELTNFSSAPDGWPGVKNQPSILMGFEPRLWI